MGISTGVSSSIYDGISSLGGDLKEMLLECVGVCVSSMVYVCCVSFRVVCVIDCVYIV